MQASEILVSVVVPTHSRRQKLERCIQALRDLDYPKKQYEVIVVDDGSTTPLAPSLLSCGETPDIRIVRQEHAGPAAARNTGAAQARGRYLAFTDDDCRPDKGWLRTLVACLTNNPQRMAAGQVVNDLPGDVLATATQLLLDYLHEHYNDKHDQARFILTSNIALPAVLLREVGGFDASFRLAAGEDRDFCDRWLSRGYGITYVPKAIVNHSHALTLRSFWRQHFNYGRGTFRFRRLRATRNKEAIQIESLRFYLKLICYPLSRTQVSRGPLLALLLLVSQVATTLGFLWAWGNDGRNNHSDQ